MASSEGFRCHSFSTEGASPACCHGARYRLLALALRVPALANLLWTTLGEP